MKISLKDIVFAIALVVVGVLYFNANNAANKLLDETIARYDTEIARLDSTIVSLDLAIEQYETDKTNSIAAEKVLLQQKLDAERNLAQFEKQKNDAYESIKELTAAQSWDSFVNYLDKRTDLD